MQKQGQRHQLTIFYEINYAKINELQLAKELIKFPSITPSDAGVMKFLEKKLKKWVSKPKF